MKTYDVTIRLTLVDMQSPLDKRDVPEMVSRKVAELAGNLASAPSRAATVRQIEVIDHDSLPQPAPVCARCQHAA